MTKEIKRHDTNKRLFRDEKMKTHKQYQEEFKRLGYNEKNFTKSFYDNFLAYQKRKEEIRIEIEKLESENAINHTNLVESSNFYNKYSVMYCRFLQMYEEDKENLK